MQPGSPHFTGGSAQRLQGGFGCGFSVICDNHGKALMAGQMNGDRWLSVALTYALPYLVNAHGQYVAKK